MKKKCFCELDKEDIAQIIANHFGVDADKFVVNDGHKIVGVGPMEREEHCIHCEVELFTETC